MELKHHLKIVWRWAWLIASGAVLAGATAFVVSRQMMPVYRASTTLLINPAPANPLAPDYYSLPTTEQLAKTYAELLRKRPVLEAALAELGLRRDLDTAAEMVEVRIVRDTQLIELSVEDTDPARAAALANLLVEKFNQQNHDLQASRYAASKENLQQELTKLQEEIDRSRKRLGELKAPSTPEQVAEQSRLQALLVQYQSSYASLLQSFEEVRIAEIQSTDNLHVVEAAQPPRKPTRPKLLLSTVLAALTGAMLALGIMFLIEYLDDTIKSDDDVERLLGIPTLAAIARIKRAKADGLPVTSVHPRSSIAEAYRTLRVNIDLSTFNAPAHTLLVTSSNPGAGKSTTIVHLAVAMAQAGKRVILVDTDLRRPALHTFFGKTNSRGLTTALLEQGNHPASDYLVATGIQKLALMPSGAVPANPAELLGSQRMVILLRELQDQADFVLLDSPPVLTVVDATVLAHICDATMLVVLSHATRGEELKRTKERLVQSGTRLLGVVVNGVWASQHDSYYYDLYYQGGHGRFAHWRRRLGSLGLRNGGGRGATPSEDTINLPAIAKVIGDHQQQERVQ